MQTAVGKDLHSRHVADTSGEIGVATSTTQVTGSGTPTHVAGTNVLTFSSSIPSNFYVGSVLSGTNVPTNTYITAIDTTTVPASPTVTMSQYAISQITTTVTATTNVLTDSTKAWGTTATAIKNVPGQWAGKTVIAGAIASYNTGTISSFTPTVTLGSGTASAGTSYVVTGSGTTFTAAMVGGIIICGTATFVITAYTSGTSITATCTISGVPVAGGAYKIIYGQYYATILSNTATTLIIDGWKSLAANTAAATPSDTAPYSIGKGGAPSFYIGLSPDTSTPTENDISLAEIDNSTSTYVNTSEIVGNGLSRALAVYAHTSGTNTYTLTKSFTYTGSTAVTIGKIGVFNAANGGAMPFTTKLPNAVTLSANGDALNITETITIS